MEKRNRGRPTRHRHEAVLARYIQDKRRLKTGSKERSQKNTIVTDLQRKRC